MDHVLKYQLDPAYMDAKENIDVQLNHINKKQTLKANDDYGNYIEPLVPFNEARFIYSRSTILRKVVEIQSQDTLLNNFSLTDIAEDTTRFDEFWNESNKYQLYLSGIEYYTYGFGALEVIFDDNNKASKLVQIPAYSIKLLKEDYKINNEVITFYYLMQEVNQHKIKLRLTHKDYTLLDKNEIEDYSTGYALWLGCGTDSDWYETPHWVQCKNTLLTLILIDELNNEKIYNGNIPSGVMLFTGPRQLTKNGEDPIEEKLQKELRSSGAGTVFSYITSPSTDARIETQYTTLEDNNYEYLEILKNDGLQTVLNAYTIPKVRLMIDDTKESMNSNKSDTIYEVYNKNIIINQLFFKQILNNFNKNYLGLSSDIVFDIPEFVEKTQNKTDMLVNLFDKGLLTLGQTVQALNDIFPEMDLGESILTDMNKDSRFYNGNLLGSAMDSNNDARVYEELTNKINNRLEPLE